MKERPIIFSTAMVQAILSGHKTMTRRVIKQQPVWVGDPSVPFKTQDADPKGIIDCPYGKPGDLLWVRETWRKTEPHEYDAPVQIEYKAGHDHACELTWKPSIHMPKKYARIWLKVTGVRVERLQDISNADEISEGYPGCNIYGQHIPWSPHGWFMSLWDSINIQRGYGWDKNPWVWVIEFERVDRPQSAKEE